MNGQYCSCSRCDGQHEADEFGRGLLTRRLNVWVLRHVSVGANTFPSGHVAGSLIAALIAWQVEPLVGASATLLALLIAFATIVGRYHYAADAVFGALVAVAIFALVG